jgi:type IV secretory pathway TrbD component
MDLSKVPGIVKGFFTGASADMKLIPHTSVSVVLLWLTLWTAGVLGWFFIYPQIALAADAVPKVRQLDATMNELKASLIVDRWGRELDRIRDDIFVLEQEIQGHIEADRQVPTSTLLQLNKLRDDREKLRLRLNNYTNQNAHLLEPVL